MTWLYGKPPYNGIYIIASNIGICTAWYDMEEDVWDPIKKQPLNYGFRLIVEKYMYLPER